MKKIYFVLYVKNKLRDTCTMTITISIAMHLPTALNAVLRLYRFDSSAS